MLTRDRGAVDYLRSYRIMLDGKRIGSIKNGQTRTFSIIPGRHELVVKIDWCRSNSMNLEIREGQTLQASCSSPFRGIRWILAFACPFITPSRYISLALDPVPKLVPAEGSHLGGL